MSPRTLVATPALALCAFLLCAVTAQPARAEIIQLLDNSQIAGRILHYYDGVFHVELSTGQKTEIPQSKIKQITFKLPPARAEFSSPDKTFNRWKDAIGKQDMGKFMDCLSLMSQGVMAAQMADASPDDLKKFWKDFEGTKLEVKSNKITGGQAALKVQRTHGDDVQTMDVRLVLENGEWKMTQ
jgi:hypothetical protein